MEKFPQTSLFFLIWNRGLEYCHKWCLFLCSLPLSLPKWEKSTCLPVCMLGLECHCPLWTQALTLSAVARLHRVWTWEVGAPFEPGRPVARE